MCLCNILLHRGVYGLLKDCKVPRSKWKTSTFMLDCRYKVFLLKCCICMLCCVSICFYITRSGHNAKLQFNLRILFQKLCRGLFMCSFVNIKYVSASLPNKLYLFQLTVTVLSQTSTSNLLSEACRLQDGCWVLSIYYDISNYRTFMSWLFFTLFKTATATIAYLLQHPFHWVNPHLYVQQFGAL